MCLTLTDSLFASNKKQPKQWKQESKQYSLWAIPFSPIVVTITASATGLASLQKENQFIDSESLTLQIPHLQSLFLFDKVNKI